jgi:hypothetical protein
MLMLPDSPMAFLYAPTKSPVTPLCKKHNYPLIAGWCSRCDVEEAFDGRHRR